jgi:hypothetical protein
MCDRELFFCIFLFVFFSLKCVLLKYYVVIIIIIFFLCLNIRDSAGSLYHEALARQLADWLQKPLDKSGGDINK